MTEGQEMRVRPQPTCPICGTAGVRQYTGLRDVLFGAPGTWSFASCPSSRCGAWWLDPQPEPDDIAAAYARYYTHEVRAIGESVPRKVYAAAKRGYGAWKYGYPAGAVPRCLGALLWLVPGRKLDADLEMMFLPALPGGRLLEVGCGAGEQLAHMAALGWSSVGIDVDQKAVDAARGRGLDARLGTLEALAFGSETFDAVMLNNVIEHVYDPSGLLREVRRILAPGGCAVVLTPNARSLGHRIYRQYWRGLEPPRHIVVFNRLSLSRVAREAGFDNPVITATVRNSRWIHVASRAIRAAHKSGAREAHVRAPGAGAETWQIGEWLLGFVRRDAGEELLMIVRKPRS